MRAEAGLGPAAALLAAAAALAFLLRRRPRLGLTAATILGGAATAALATGLPQLDLGLGTAAGSPAPVRSLLVATACELGLVVLLAPGSTNRLTLLGTGLAGMGCLVLIAATPDLLLAAAAIVLLALGQALLPGLRTFSARLRGPALGSAVLAAGTLLIRSHQGGAAPRLGALFLAAGIVAVAGLMPFLAQFEPSEPFPASALAWTGMLAPVLVPVLVWRAVGELEPATAPVFAAVMIGLGLVNLAGGLVAAWQAEDDSGAWRNSFLADWGLALVGLGLLIADGAAAAYLVLLGLVLVRLPLYLFARPVLRGLLPRRMGALNLLLAGLLVGLAPFAGFAGRLLLLRGAIHLYAPLAVVIGLALLLWLGHGFRLASSLGRPSGRAAIGVGVATAASLAIGIWPGLWLHGGGFQP